MPDTTDTLDAVTQSGWAQRARSLALDGRCFMDGRRDDTAA